LTGYDILFTSKKEQLCYVHKEWLIVTLHDILKLTASITIFELWPRKICLMGISLDILT